MKPKNQNELTEKSDSSEEIDTDVEGVYCEVCGKKFGSISSKNSHFRSKHQGRCFICPICNDDFVSKFALERHVERFHSPKKLTAPDENEFYVEHKVEMSNASKDALISRLKTELQEKNSIIDELKSTIERLQSQIRKPNELRPEYGVNAISSWVRTTTEMLKVLQGKNLEGEFLLSLTGEELNELLGLFIKNIRKPNGTTYAIDTLYYLMLSLQKYFHQNGKYLNIMYDCKATSDALNEMISNSINTFLEGGKR